MLNAPDRIEQSIDDRRNAYRLLGNRLLKGNLRGRRRKCGSHRDRERKRRRIAMKIEYDKQVDALYIRIQEKDVARTQEVSDGVNLDFDN